MRRDWSAGILACHAAFFSGVGPSRSQLSAVFSGFALMQAGCLRSSPHSQSEIEPDTQTDLSIPQGPGGDKEFVLKARDLLGVGRVEVYKFRTKRKDRAVEHIADLEAGTKTKPLRKPVFPCDVQIKHEQPRTRTSISRQIPCSADRREREPIKDRLRERRAAPARDQSPQVAAKVGPVGRDLVEVPVVGNTGAV